MPSEREKVIAGLAKRFTAAWRGDSFMRDDAATVLREAYDVGRDAGYRQGVEDGCKAVENEHLLDNTGIDTDIAYDSAVDDCLAAIRSLSPAEEAKT